MRGVVACAVALRLRERKLLRELSPSAEDGGTSGECDRGVGVEATENEETCSNIRHASVAFVSRTIRARTTAGDMRVPLYVFIVLDNWTTI
jgi:hypothetical protein